jgi:hypothetical protein
MKFIHCADVHLDTPLQGLSHYPGAPVNEIRNAESVVKLLIFFPFKHRYKRAFLRNFLPLAIFAKSVIMFSKFHP